jgi:hypothetical protein
VELYSAFKIFIPHYGIAFHIQNLYPAFWNCIHFLRISIPHLKLPFLFRPTPSQPGESTKPVSQSKKPLLLLESLPVFLSQPARKYLGDEISLIRIMDHSPNSTAKSNIIQENSSSAFGIVFYHL